MKAEYIVTVQQVREGLRQMRPNSFPHSSWGNDRCRIRRDERALILPVKMQLVYHMKRRLIYGQAAVGKFSGDVSARTQPSSR